MQNKVSYYEESLRLSQHRGFSSSSEKSATESRQILLFYEAENEAEAKRAEPSVEEITYYEKQARRFGQEGLR